MKYKIYFTFDFCKFKFMKTISIKEFYSQINTEFPKEISKEIGHFNVFNIKELIEKNKDKPVMPYDRRAYYKISLIKGKNKVEYADKIIEINKNALLFATPKIPYHYIAQDKDQSGIFCVFTSEFFTNNKFGFDIDDLPLFKSDICPIFQLTDDEVNTIELIFNKIQAEINSEYSYKYDLIRNYVAELIHFGQKSQPISALYSKHNSASRVTSLFLELLERQFPIESINQKIELKTASHFADRLSIHVNHLNKVLKEITGISTKNLISDRITTEAKILLKQTDWTISEIAYSLGFEEIAHFSNFFKKQSSLTPLAFRK